MYKVRWNKYPGKYGKPFKIVISQDMFKKGDIIQYDRFQKAYVTKKYRMTLWRKFLLWLGFKVKLIDFTFKVQPFKDDNHD